MVSMWELEPTDEFARRFKRYEKKHPRELKAVLANLEVIQESLQSGTNPQKLPFGFIHIEQRGVIAIDQKRGGKNLAQTRLYVYLDRDTETIHLITLGDKASQHADVKTASDYVDGLKSQKDHGSHGQEEAEKRNGLGDATGSAEGVQP
jgi:hypothetical protein